MGKQAMVTLSFDDGREDTYRVAFKIMKEYGLVGTINVTTGWVDGSWSVTNWPSAVDGAMTIEQVKECFNYGFEIASHGDTHITEVNDLRACLIKLRGWGVIDPDYPGFASPYSELTAQNLAKTAPIFMENNIKYVRTGHSHKCKRWPMRILFILQWLTGSSLLFQTFFKHNSILLPMNQPFMLPASEIKRSHSANQVIRLLQRSISSKSWNILMLHSILESKDKGYGQDVWYWDADEFRQLCQWLSKQDKQDIAVVTTKVGLKNLLENWEESRDVVNRSVGSRYASKRCGALF
ncbi:polysaccharide deacetylase family protein [Desulfitobacterium sp. THU1]|uniref:polysaccharide deacetylase family protein n=1 Tax=Desulfitobacterium sp. THU1 TaxID=3138072 RepID=UPI00311ED070